jgi:type 1 glutamine amidotransferase
VGRSSSSSGDARDLASGGGYVGVHSATDTEYDWPWYGQLIGGDAWFRSHPAIQTATLKVEDPTYVSARHYPPTFSFTDEWYNFRQNPRPSVNVLLTIDESSYNPGTNAMGEDHPISWSHDFDGGRSRYTAMGRSQRQWLSRSEREELWRRWRKGESLREIGRGLERPATTINQL